MAMKQSFPSIAISSLFVFGSLVVSMMLGCQNEEQMSKSNSSIDQKNNVLFILVDDMGWEDVGFMGSQYYATPNIDDLASNSLVFESAYSSSPNCAPTRAALFSGQYSARTKVYTVAPKDRGAAHKRALETPQNAEYLDGEVITLAEQFKQAGYATGFFGKWHLGDFEGESSPLAQGFDINRGGYNKGHPKTYFSPYNNPALEDGPKGEYLTDRLTHEAIRFIDQQDDNTPFFAFLSYYAVHTPLQPKPEMVFNYQSVPFESRQGHPHYAAMVENLDTNIGFITDYLKSKGLLDNTLIVFTSDNGGHSGATRMPSLRGAKGMMYEGGVRVPLFYHLPNSIPAGTTSVISSSIDHYPTLLSMTGITPQHTILDGADLSPVLVSSDNQNALSALELRALYWHFPFYLEGTSRPNSRNTDFASGHGLGNNRRGLG